MVVRQNRQRKQIRNAYGRIDLVIVADHARGLGLARVLVNAALVHMLEAFDQRLYSISCLAAHPAIEVILTQVGFVKREPENDGFVHQELRTDELDVRMLIDDFVAATTLALQSASFRCRQQRAKP